MNAPAEFARLSALRMGGRRGAAVAPGGLGRAAEESLRINGLRALPHLEMQLRLFDSTSLANPADHLTTAYRVATLNHGRVQVRVGRDEAISMAHQDQGAKAANLIANMGHHTVLCRAHRRAAGGRDVQAVIVLAPPGRTKRADHPPAHGP